MKIQYASDLHLEFEENLIYVTKSPLKPEGDILILAGDIAYLTLLKVENSLKNKLLTRFFDFISDNFKQTFIIPGNHEFYLNEDISYSLTDFEYKVRSNVTYLNNKSIEYNEVKIVFSTLWSRLGKNFPRYRFADFNQCNYLNLPLTIEAFNYCHSVCREFLQSEFSLENDKPMIVVTHHLPSRLLVSKEYESSDINDAFASDSDDLIKKSNASYWILGHSHFNNAPMRIGTTEMISNCLGYVHLGENKPFNHSATIQI